MSYYISNPIYHRIDSKDKRDEKSDWITAAAARCRRIDHYAILAFMGGHALTICTYFYLLHVKS